MVGNALEGAAGPREGHKPTSMQFDKYTVFSSRYADAELWEEIHDPYQSRSGSP